MNRDQEILAQAQSFAKDNLKAGCLELLEMSKTGILKSQGVVRECAAILSMWESGVNVLAVAESLFKNAAFEFVVKE